MLKDNDYIKPTDVDLLVFEKLVPQDHFLRRVKAGINFEVMREALADSYHSTMGRPGEDPVRMVKLLVLQCGRAVGAWAGAQMRDRLLRDVTPFAPEEAAREQVQAALMRASTADLKTEKSHTEVVQGARNSLAALLQDVGVDHGRGKIVVPEQLLNGADVGAALEQVSGEGMAKGVSADLLGQAGTADGRLDGFVDDAGINMMATGDARTRVYGEIPGGQDILPAPFLGGIRILPSQSMGQVDLALTLSQVLLMQRLDPGQVVLEQRGERGGKGGEPVFVALARTDGQLLQRTRL
jgi:hypothetical protein